MQHLEIERKFLVDPQLWKEAEKPEGVPYQQGYLCGSTHGVVRVRIAGDRATLTIKGKLKGLGRQEFEYEIPVSDAKDLLQLAEGNLIEKTRYKVWYEGKLWDVDWFQGDNDGLFMAEIELDAEDETFAKPVWIGKEVSDDLRYYNSYLAKHPFRTWSIRESNP